MANHDTPQPPPPAAPDLADLAESMAGEEDPGAALDVVADMPAGKPKPPPAPTDGGAAPPA